MKTNFFLFVLVATLLIACGPKEQPKPAPKTVPKVEKVIVPEEPAPIIDTKPKLDLSQNYLVIVNSFAREDFAKREIENMKALDFHAAAVMVHEDGYYRIAISSFDTKDEAIRFIKEHRETSPELEAIRFISQKNGKAYEKKFK